MKNNKVLALILLILIFVLAACGGGEATTEEPTTNEETAVQSDNTEAEVEMETAVSLADEVRVEEGGFAFQPPVGYEVSSESLFAELTAADDPETQINIFGFPLMEGMDLTAMYEGATAEFATDETINLSEREDISVNGLDGFTATMSGEEDGLSLKGKIVILGNEAQGVFLLAGAEESKWDGGVAEQTEAVINSISLFEIAMPELLVEEVEESEEPEAVEEADATEEVAEEAEPEAEAAPEFDTVFPVPADVANLMGEGGEADLNFQTSLSLEEVLEFYRTELIAQGLVERDLLTVVEESVISIVFDGSENGKAIVVQGVDLGESTNVNIRFEDT